MLCGASVTVRPDAFSPKTSNLRVTRKGNSMSRRHYKMKTKFFAAFVLLAATVCLIPGSALAGTTATFAGR